MTSPKMLVDTNVLLRIATFSISHQSDLRRSVLALRNKNRLCVTLQNVAEFWNVSTRPVKLNGFGRDIREVASEVDKLTTLFEVLPETEDTFRRWRELVEESEVKGVLVHDARLAAIMYEYGITRILTFNARDFARFPFITAVPPLGDIGHA